MSETHLPETPADTVEPTVIFYRDEDGHAILFGFFRLPDNLDLEAEINAFHQEGPKSKLLSLAGWLIEKGARSIVETDAAYRTVAGTMKHPIIKRIEERPIRIDPTAIDAKSYELTW